MSQTALITGASGGIGRELAKRFAQDGWNLVVVARSEGKLNELKRELETQHGVQVRVIAQDLAQSDAARQLCERLSQEHIEVDALVNNAGFGDNANYLESEWSRQEQLMNLNVMALMQLTYRLGRTMRERGHGRILNVASIASFMAGPGMASYYASKAFVRSFSEAVAAELRGSGVTVTALCPGPVRTNFEAAAHMEGSWMFKLLFPANPRTVAEAGYRAMMRGRRLCYPGLLPQLAGLFARVAPRRLSAAVAGFVNRHD